MPSIPLQWSWWETRPLISEAATEQGIATIAALYGYGDKAKLLAERPRYLTDDPEWRTLRKAE